MTEIKGFHPIHTQGALSFCTKGIFKFIKTAI